MHKLLHICIYNGPTLSNLEDLSSLSYKKSNFMTFNPFEFFKRIKRGGSWSLYRSHHVIKVHEAPIDLITQLTAVVWCNANKATVKTKRTKYKSNFYIYIYIYDHQPSSDNYKYNHNNVTMSITCNQRLKNSYASTLL